MLTLLRLPFFRSAILRTFLFLLKNYGAPPLARARVKRRLTPASTWAVSPVFRALSHPKSLRSAIRLCRPAL
jgi:hypothetical protein